MKVSKISIREAALSVAKLVSLGKRKKKKKEVNEYRVDDEKEFVCVPIKQLVRRL